MTVELVVNGAAHTVPAPEGRTLLETLREELGLTGAKYGCGEGECGACTVIVGGNAVRSCVLPTASLDGAEVRTVEGLAADGVAHPVQRALVEAEAAQCGYCTPGMVMSAVALLERTSQPTDDEIVAAMDGNLCRCCGYPALIGAIRAAATAEPVPVPAAQPPPALAAVAVPWDMTADDSRSYFDALGDGLVAVLPPTPEAEAWSPGSVGGGAWLHVSPTGVATLFTGKVDVGQGTRAALGLLVAEELGLGPDAVTVVMGDTDVCPFDEGTFGSRGMPVAGRATRLVAAAARAALSRLAEGEDVPLGELLEGQRLLVAADGAQAEPHQPAAWRVAGQPAADPSAWDAVLGTRRFTTDVALTGMLEACIVRPPRLGAQLRAADLSASSAAAVARIDDLVCVAAPERRDALRAAESVSITWDVPDGIGEEELAGYLRSHPDEVEGWGGPVDDAVGDPEGVLASGQVLADTYTTAYLAHAPLETRCAVAEWRNGRLTVWVGTQRPFAIREILAERLGLDERRVRVVVPKTGGGFGGKHSPETALCAARLAIDSGRPVKLRWSREEEFSWAYFRPAAVIDLAACLDEHGHPAAWSHTVFNAGAASLGCPYDFPHMRLRSHPTASPLPQGAYRALGATANTFARERHIDRLARGAGRDPVEFRFAHVADARTRAVLEAVATRVGDASGRALGFAVGTEKGGHVATCAELVPDGDGVRLTRIVTAFECGAIVDPRKLRAQVEGATVMGLGGALFEAVRFDHGRIVNPSFAEYRVSRFSDVPLIEVELIDRPDLEPAGGGETPIVAVAPAIANAAAAAGGGERVALPFALGG